MTLDVDGAPIKTALYRSYKAAEMAGKPIKITNTGDTAVQAVVSVSGAPVTPEPAASNGFKIERNYFTLDGKPADVSKAKQNDRFAVVLKITEAKPEYGHIMVSDYLPAGLEIDNPHLVSSGDTGTLDWIEDGEEPENTEFRDDRFTAAIDRASDDKAVFTVAYVVARCHQANTCCRRPMSRICTTLRAMAAPAPARSRCARRNEHIDRHSAGGAQQAPLATDQAGAISRVASGRRFRGMGRLAGAVATGVRLAKSRPRSSTAMASCCAPMRWPTAAGGCRSTPGPVSIPAISNYCWPMKTGASVPTLASILLPWAARRFN